MKTLDQTQLTTIHGGFEPLNDFVDSLIRDNWGLQLALEQLAREQEAALLREMLLAQAD